MAHQVAAELPDPKPNQATTTAHPVVAELP